MNKTPPFEDALAVHRWFGIEANNRAWAILEQPKRTIEEKRELLTLAHVSTYHWSRAGKEIHRLRGLVLLCHAHAIAGSAALAVDLFNEAISLMAREPEGMGDFDVASAHAAATAAHEANGDESRASEMEVKARQAGGRLTDAFDKKVFDRLMMIRR